jgi:arylformamidase
MKIIDITGVIEPGMWGFGPPFPDVELTAIGSFARDGWVSHAISLGGNYRNIHGDCGPFA